MTFYRPTTDASDLYHPSASSASGDAKETAAPGNLADFMKNAVMVEVEVEQLEAMEVASTAQHFG